jgi:fucose permease
MKIRTFPVFLAFLAMGFGDAVGPFVSLAKDQFHLSNTVASLIPFVGFSMFGLLSVPMGVFQDRRGKKTVLTLGLVIALVGMLNASFGLTTFVRFLLTVLLLDAGAAILQVAGNPIMRDVSAPGKYARNLSLGQFVKAIGSLSGPIIPWAAGRYFHASWQVMFPIYAVALAITVLAVSTLKVKEDTGARHAATFSSCLALLANGYVLAMVGAIFFYVGAEVCMSSYIPLFLKEQFSIDVAREGLLGTGLFFTALTIGRFSGGVILNWMAPRKFLALTCAVSIVGLLGLFVPVAAVAVAACFVIGLGFANIFPLVFSTAIEAMPQHANPISGLMVTAIVGGAILPPLMGVVADHSSVMIGFVVPLAAIAYVTTAGLLAKPKAA